ncbi:MAG: VOC family protein [Clostridium sp.]|uniref:VOC family protein n=1 Tax=Clostridium sp. TaxID=1506 RepID=UPI003EE5ABB6
MRYKLNTINVKNLAESIKFYEDVLDMKVIREISPSKDVKIAFLKGIEEGVIELIEGKKFLNEEGNISLGFDVDNIDETIKKLNHFNVKLLGEPIEIGNDTKILFAKDPNGVTLEFLENLNF